MCLIAFAWQAHPRYRLIVAANRDEHHLRPSQDAHWWPDRRQVLAGRDLQAGGTWLAMSRTGRFATVTNYREGQPPGGRYRSRGELVTAFVDAAQPPDEFARSIDGDRYAGFSLLTAVAGQLAYVSNRGDAVAVLDPGVYGLSNAALDTPWSKLLRSKDALSRLIAADAVNESELLRLLTDRQPAPAAEIDAGNLPFALARAVSAPFIVSPDYGTRCSTTLLWSYDDEVEFCERRYDPAGEVTGTTRHRFSAAPAPQAA